MDAARAARLAREAELKKQVEARVSKIEVRLCLPLIAFHFHLLFGVRSLPLHPDISWRADRSHPTNMGDKVKAGPLEVTEPFVHLIRIITFATNVYHVYFILGCLISLPT